MSIISIQRIAIGEVGVNPGRIKVLTTDSLATITTAGYFNGANLQGITIGPLDVLEIDYAYNASTGTASWAEFTPTFSNGIITIHAAVSPGNVLLPVVSGDFPIFNGTSGQIKDSAMSATDPTKTKLVALNAAPLVNHIAYFTNANGTIGADGSTIINSGNIQAGVSGTAGTFRSFPAGALSGILTLAAATNASGNFNTTISNATAVGQNQVISIPDSGAATANFLLNSGVQSLAAGSAIVYNKVNGVEAANAVTADGSSGVITTSALTTAGGANYAITWTNSFISATSTVLISLQGGTNTVKNITLQIVPGAGTATLTIYNNTAATALDGTILIGYLVV